MICPHCRQETRDTSAFCTKCGRPLRAGTPPTSAAGSPGAAIPGARTPPGVAGAPPGGAGPVREAAAGPPGAGYGPPSVQLPQAAVRPGAPPSPPRRSAARLIVPLATGLVVVTVLAYVVAQSQGGRSPQPSPTPPPPSPGATTGSAATTASSPDCSQASHPPQGSVERKEMLDALRRHYTYSGLYTVQFVTVYRGWAYLEAAQYDQSRGQTVGEYRGYLLRFDGTQWNWRWEGPTGAEADGPGNPPYPSDFRGSARDVLRC